MEKQILQSVASPNPEKSVMQKNIPALRFPEFEGEWVRKKLGDVINFKAGYAFKSEEMLNEKSTYQILKMSNVYQSELRLDRNPSFWKKIDKKQSEFLLKEGDTILTLTGTVGKRDFGYSVAIKENNQFLLNQRLVLLREIKGISINIFINQLLSNERFLYCFFGEAKGGTGNQTNVGVEDVKNIRLNFPTLPEQTKIAAFLTSVDEKLQALKKKQQLLEQYKKGVMQQLFSHNNRSSELEDYAGENDSQTAKSAHPKKLRFKQKDGSNFPDWEVKKLGEVLEYEQPTNYLVSSTEYNDKFETPVLTAGKTFILGYTDETYGIFNKDLPVIIFDDFTTATQFVNFPFKAKSSAMKILKSKGDVDIKFIYEAIQMIDYEIGGHGRHWISVFAEMEINLPSLPEQTAIANFLSSLDEKINQTKTQIEKTEAWKKGLLQKMFV